MSYQTDYELLSYQPLKERATSALMEAARDIIFEDPSTANHANRLIWAESITDTNAAKAEVERAMIWIAANPTLRTKFAADGELGNTVEDDQAIKYIINSEVLPRRVTLA